MLVKLRTSTQLSGIGKVSTTIDLRRHWVTWQISGGPGFCSLRVPMLWVHLDGIERVAHTQMYQSLPKLPIPHPAFASNPIIMTSNESPYEFDITHDEHEVLTRRLYDITCEAGSGRRSGGKHPVDISMDVE